jgi:pyruvate dehydrogenase E2 component (dihydrolipoamide acetyltransferase)
MATAITMPKLGNTVESSIIVKWRKRAGDAIAQDETLCEVETDKAVMEVTSMVAGTVLELFFNEGDDVPVLTNIAAIGQPGESVEHLRPGGVMAQPATAPATAEPASDVASPPPAERAEDGGNGTIVGVSPRARGLAHRKGVSLEGIAGTGPGGRIIERDVMAALTAQPKMTPLARSMVEKGDFVAPPQGTGVGGRIMTKDLKPANAKPAPEPTPVPDEDVKVISVKGTRKIIAERMLGSLQTTAQLTLNAFADARGLQNYRKKLKNSPERMGLQKVTINDLVLFAVSRTLPQFPDLNALFEGESIRQYGKVHLGLSRTSAYR